MRALRLTAVVVLAVVFMPAGGRTGGRTALAAEVSRLDIAESGYIQVDPIAVSTASDERIVSALFEGLTVLDAKTGRAAPGVASTWTMAPDGRSWTFALRPDAVWGNGTPVVAKDFVFAWKRAVDPLNPVYHASLFRALRGVAAIQEANAALTALDKLSKGLREMIGANPNGIPGDQVTALMDESGARPYLARLESKDVRRMMRWGSEPFETAKATEARNAVIAERRKHKEVLQKGLDTFGITGGALAKDDHTLVVETEGWRPWLPELLARAVFSPLQEENLKTQRDAAFEPSGFVGNGPYHLKGRGVKPRAGLDKPNSVVHLAKNPKYVGPNVGMIDEILCWTDLEPVEEVRRLADPTTPIEWLASPAKESRAVLEKNPGFRTRPLGTVIYLVIRPDFKPFDKKDARRAFALAVDRAALAKLFWPAADPAERLVPPDVRNSPGGVAAPKGNAQDAKAAVKAVGLKADQWPWIELFHEDADGPTNVASTLAETWTKNVGIDASAHIDTGVEYGAVFGGKFPLILQEGVGGWDDPSAYLESFHSHHPADLTGWHDEALDLMIQGLHDVEALAAGLDKVVPVVKDGPGLKAKVEAAKAGSEASREALRQVLLAEVEQRLLSEFVVVPICFPRKAEVVQKVANLGGDEAWKNPAFPGALRAATR